MKNSYRTEPPAVDLLGDVLVTDKRTNSKPEAAALCEVLLALRNHPAVAWCERQNSGAAKVGNRFIRFGWQGCSDILGQMKDGRFLAVECKAPKGRVSTEQSLFLKRRKSIVRARGRAW